MMHGSTGGEHDLSDALASFEGLVLTTARMFASQVRREEEDLAQELRVKVWHAVRAYDPGKGLPLERFVFGAITNRIKDFKRGAAREADRRERNGLTFLHIEDTRPLDSEAPAERFDQLYYHSTHDDVYGDVELEQFRMPAGVTECERRVAALLVVGCDRDEIGVLLGLSYAQVGGYVRTLRIKLSDWRPGSLERLQLGPDLKAAQRDLQAA